MRTATRLALVIVTVTSLFAASLPGFASAPSSDGALLQRLRRPDAGLDPVLSALAAHRLVRDVPALPPGKIEVPPVAVGFAPEGAQLAGLDVSGSSAGRQELAAFVDRLRGRGLDPAGTDFTVYSLPSIREAEESARDRGGAAELLDDGPLASAPIVPVGTKVEFVGATFDDGRLHAKTVVSAAPQPPPALMAAPSDSASFVRAGGIGCMHRKQKNTAWYDPCQEYYQLENDRDAAKNYWASQLWGTGKSKSIWTLDGLEVFARRADKTPAQDWVDWDPGADSDLNCQPQSLEVSYGGASVGITKQHCDMWDISKHEDVRFSNWWRGSAWRKERETAMVALTKTDAGRLPRQVFDFDYYAK